MAEITVNVAVITKNPNRLNSPTKLILSYRKRRFCNMSTGKKVQVDMSCFIFSVKVQLTLVPGVQHSDATYISYEVITKVSLVSNSYCAKL